MIWVLFATLAVCLCIRIPVGFSIGISSMTYLLVSGAAPITIVAQKMVDGASSFTMMALPMFVFSGALMAYGCTPRLMRFANLLVGRMPGGLGAAGLTALGFFGAVSGSGVASTVAVGTIVGPEMVKQGYSKGLTAGLMAAGGAMASLIPPSIVMVVYGASSGASIGDLFLAGIIPGVLTIAGLIVLNCFMAVRRGYHTEVAATTAKEKLKICLDAILPLLMPLIIVGGVLSGLLTPTESAVVATVYAFVLAAFVYRELDLREFVRVAGDSAVTSSIILLIISTAAPFGWVLATQNVPQNFTQWLLELTSNPYVIMGAITILLLILGTFMETVCIIILMTPILLPVVTSLGMDPVHFGIAMLMNLAVGAMTPPLSVALFTACRIIKIKVEQSFPDVLYVVGVVLIITILTTAIPQLSMFLPGVLR